MFVPTRNNNVSEVFGSLLIFYTKDKNNNIDNKIFGLQYKTGKEYFTGEIPNWMHQVVTLKERYKTDKNGNRLEENNRLKRIGKVDLEEMFGFSLQKFISLYN